MLAMDSQSRVGDLRNEIHAVFRRKNFRNISDDEYDALKPPLQFASLFLTTPDLAGFPHAIPVGAYKHVPHPDNRVLDEWSYQEKSSKLSSRDMAMYSLALTTFADMVAFVADDTEDAESGSCCRDRESSSHNTHLQRGSTVYFSRQDIEVHLQLRDTTDPDDFNRKWFAFLTAKILLHELMHAMSYARLGSFADIPFGSNKVVETGYEWESHIFGGTIFRSSLRPSGLGEDESLMIADWPSASITRYYQHVGYTIDVREEPPPIEIWWWLMPTMPEWFKRLFTTNFWEKTVPDLGAAALKPPRVRGYSVMIVEDGTPTLFIPNCEDAAFYGCSIPAGYIEDEEGEVVVVE